MNLVVALANPENIASYCVLEKLGFHCEKELVLNNEPLRFYALERQV
jgi:hypothetical protein